jgi:GDP-4-dehydro-6-deoxy-D-mannose reductase
MARRALVTGAAGFIGRHLTAHLSDQGYEVHGLDRTRPEDWSGPWHVADVMDSVLVRAIVAATQPDVVFHLAALTRGSLSELLAANVGGTDSLLAALVAERPDARVLVTGSAAEYGLARTDELPLSEEQPLRPLSPYGVSKVAQSVLATQVALRQELEVVCTRSFNVTGPGEPETLVCAAFARQIAEIEAGLRPSVVHVGNLSASRDFLDVRDAVRAYVLALERGKSGEVYNVSSGTAVPVSRILELLLELGGVAVSVESESARRVPWDVPVHCGSSVKLQLKTGWTPELELKQSLDDLLGYWRARVARTA